ncbi:MAG: hypothetical protein LBS86_05115, partial [Treponema sp.]|nr:hypothetical protein [Treponema sp.]
SIKKEERKSLLITIFFDFFDFAVTNSFINTHCLVLDTILEQPYKAHIKQAPTALAIPIPLAHFTKREHKPPRLFPSAPFVAHALASLQ